MGACLVLLLLAGWADYLTGYEMGLFLFYSVPVAIAAWHLGRGPALGVAVAASFTWLLADRLSGDKYSTPFVAWWNTAMHCGSFAINAWTIAKIKSDLDHRHQLAAELASARDQLSVARKERSTCPHCGMPKLPADPSPSAAEDKAAGQD